MKSLILLFTLSLILLVGACVPTADIEPANDGMFDVATVAIRPSATPIPLVETPTPPATATDIPIGEPTLSPTSTIDPTVLTTTPWPPGPVPSPTPAQPFPGMVYTTDEGLWRVNAGWQPELLFDKPGVLEPNGRRLLFEGDNDIWLLDLVTGKQQNITNTPDSIECCPEWWPNKPDTFLVLTYYDDFFGPVLGQMTALTLTGENKILIEETGGEHSISPDGQMIAFEIDFMPVIYHEDSSIEWLTEESESLEEASWIIFDNPSWSPDGQKIAWNIYYGDESRASWAALAVHHLGEQRVQVLHPIQRGIVNDVAQRPVWHPNSDWVIFDAVNGVLSQQESWLIAIDGSFQKWVGYTKNLVWSPDGRYLLYQNVESYFLTAPPDFTYKIGVSLPPDAKLLDWQILP